MLLDSLNLAIWLSQTSPLLNHCLYGFILNRVAKPGAYPRTYGEVHPRLGANPLHSHAHSQTMGSLGTSMSLLLDCGRNLEETHHTNSMHTDTRYGTRTPPLEVRGDSAETEMLLFNLPESSP